ncbi:MAG: transglycosylase domain-containing protein [bacterium]|nr:transglycosylase domain-containing protein [bacterium]
MPNYGFGKAFQRSQALLGLIGKPFYLSLSALVIVLVGIFWTLGQLLRLLLNGVSFWLKFVPLLSRLIFLKVFMVIRRVKLPHFPRLPRPMLPTIHLPVPELPSLPRTVRYVALPKGFKKLTVVTFLIASSVVIFWFLLLRDLPKPGELITRRQAVSTKIYARDGQLLYKFFKNVNRTVISLEETPLYFRQATIAIEDKDFYNHTGFSPRGIARAIFRNITRGEATGGSTITQQLVKNALLTPEKTLTRKIKELILAVEVEVSFSKDQILEMYLNEVAYGGSAYGSEEASQLYFGKSVKNLTLGEAALLAGLPKAPTTYSPFGANPAFAKARQLEVLGRMVQEDYITQTEAEIASSEQLVFAPQRTDIKAPHFVMYVKQLLAEIYGEEVVEEGGLEVTTSLDLKVQEIAEKSVGEEVEKIRGLRISNGAALVTNPANGEILAMVGSKDYFDQTIDGNFNVTTALRQPGSSIKPVNYSYALESGRYTAAMLLPDSPITYQIPGSEPYSPRNYDSTFHGNVPLRIALASSYNVPAVKVLASYGVDKMLEQGKKMGITSWEDPKRFGLSLTLGGGEVKIVDMAVAYGTLANYGRRVNLNPILKIADYHGKVLEEGKCEVNQVNRLTNSLVPTARAAEAAPLTGCGEQVLDSRVAFIITDILHDNNARTPAFGPNSLLNIPAHPEVAVKTGTTQNLRDNWAIGYTQNYVVVTWVGNNDNTPMAYVASGVTGATPIWQRIMMRLLEGKENHTWDVPSGIVQTSICPLTGTLPCEGCPTRTEYFIEGTQPTQYCNLKEQIEKKKEEKALEGQILSDEDALRAILHQ